MRIIIDAMGGDNAPEAVVKAAVKAAGELKCDITLVGREEIIKPLLGDNANVGLVHAPEVVSMEDAYAMSVVSKKDSSMMKALNMLKDGEADAVISAGSTGALLTGATLIVRRIKGIKRAALATVYPREGGYGLLLDSGANAECTAEMLVQFALMGHCYAKAQFGLDRAPRIGLLNNGTEEGKGTATIKEAYTLLKDYSQKGVIDFIGNVEGRDLFAGQADVVVCDGFSGNIALKTIEGTAYYIMNNLKKAFYKNALTKLCALGVKSGVSGLKKSLDYREVGGVPFLGTRGVVIKAHGSSDERAFYNAIAQAMKCVESGYISEIESSLSELAGE